MPFYDYHCTSCGHTFEKNMKMQDCDLPTTFPCPECQSNTISKTITSAGICDPVFIGVKKVPSDFQKYVLGRIKQHHPKGNIERTKSIAKEI